MDYVTRVEGRKIAVHCHAGLGRTGLAIACFFVFSGIYDNPEAAIAAVRVSRPGAVQTRNQVAFVTIFAQYLQYLRCVYPTSAPRQSGKGKSGTLHGSGSAGDITDGGGGGSSLATRSAPPGGLPKDGLLERKETGNAVVGKYSSGLTVTVPVPVQVQVRGVRRVWTRGCEGRGMRK
jgi:protein tyrosine phosphatase domain-containing protein 1